MPEQTTRPSNERLQGLISLYEEALKAIRGPMDDPSGLDWRMQAYREAGGGYEGLQAVAVAALAAGMTSIDEDC